MPNQRADNQTLIAFALNRKLLQAVDQACTVSGEDRSTFIRQALVNVIKERHGVVQPEWVKAQVRARGTHHYAPAPVKAATGAVPKKISSSAQKTAAKTKAAAKRK